MTRAYLEHHVPIRIARARTYRRTALVACLVGLALINAMISQRFASAPADPMRMEESSVASAADTIPAIRQLHTKVEMLFGWRVDHGQRTVLALLQDDVVVRIGYEQTGNAITSVNVEAVP